jgi:hypothetical protein
MLKWVAVMGVLVALLTSGPPARAAWDVWTVTGTVRARRNTPPGEGRAVHLSAARDETESFQILIRSDAPVRGIRLEAGRLAGSGGAVIPAAEIRLFRQHFLHLTVPTYRNEAFEAGWYADPLIPFRHPLTGEALPADARFRAIPFDLPAGETHGFLVDVHVPADAGPGTYRGAVRATAEETAAVEIPVTLTVRNFALPRVSTMHTAFGSPAHRMRDHYRRRATAGKEKEPADWDAVDLQCAAMLSRHRINATPAPEMLLPERRQDGTYRFTDEQVDALRAFVDTYHVNALSVRRPTSIVKDPEKEKEKLHAWLAAFDDLAKRLDRPGIVFYTYLKDEPNDAEAYRFVQQWGRAVREAGSVVKVLVVEQTWPQKEEWGDLYGAVDIWCALFPLFKPESAAKRQAKGETVWAYTALCQARPTPWWHIDFPILNYRVPVWIAWRHRIRGLLYWGGLSFWRQVDDPWTQPETLDRRDRGKGQVWNGEGSIVYPGRACGYDGIAPSLRLKALRDAVEDYEYFSILQRAGRAEEAEAVVRPLAESWFEWEKDPAAYEKARARLAEMIEAGQSRN